MNGITTERKYILALVFLVCSLVVYSSGFAEKAYANSAVETANNVENGESAESLEFSQAEKNDTQDNATFALDAPVVASAENNDFEQDLEAVSNGDVRDSKGLSAASSRALNGWVERGGYWYYYDNGRMLRNCWLMDSVDWCYFGDDGRAFRNMWANLWDSDGLNWYYFDNNSRIVRNKWQRDSTAWCLLDSKGHAVKNTWVSGTDPYGSYRPLIWFDAECHAKKSNEPWASYL